MKSETTIQLEKAIYKETNKQGVFGCFEVTIGWYGNERVDYMTYDTKGIWRCYEVKSSTSDFHSKCKHTFIGHYNYYVMPNELYDKVKDEIPSHIGVYCYGNLVKRPKRQELTVDEQIMKDSFIRSLYRDVEKFYQNGNDSLVTRLKSKISKLENNIAKLQRRHSYSNNAFNILEHHFYRQYGDDWMNQIGLKDYQVDVINSYINNYNI